MGVDWFVGRRCRAKDAFTAEGILERVKKLAVAEGVVEEWRETHGDGPLDEIMDATIVYSSWGEDGVERVRDWTVRELFEFGGELEPYVEDCKECAANVIGLPFGCTGSINYPISAAGERWLMRQLPALLDSAVGKLLRQTKEGLGWDGGDFTRLRGVQGRFFELTRAPIRRWGWLGASFILSADEFYQGMLEGFAIEPIRAVMICFFAGAVAPSTLSDFLDSMDPTAAGEFRMSPHDLGERSASQFAMFFKATHRASQIGVVLNVTY